MKILENTMLSCIKRLTIIKLKDSKRKKNYNLYISHWEIGSMVVIISIQKYLLYDVCATIGKV